MNTDPDPADDDSPEDFTHMPSNYNPWRDSILMVLGSLVVLEFVVIVVLSISLHQVLNG